MIAAASFVSGDTSVRLSRKKMLKWLFTRSNFRRRHQSNKTHKHFCGCSKYVFVSSLRLLTMHLSLTQQTYVHFRDLYFKVGAESTLRDACSGSARHSPDEESAVLRLERGWGKVKMYSNWFQRYWVLTILRRGKLPRRTGGVPCSPLVVPPLDSPQINVLANWVSEITGSLRDHGTSEKKVDDCFRQRTENSLASWFAWAIGGTRADEFERRITTDSGRSSSIAVQSTSNFVASPIALCKDSKCLELFPG